MTKVIQGSAADCDEETLAIEGAEAEFILAVQSEIQKILNSKGLRARDLSKRLRVTEARISQMFGDQAKNLTLRSIARIFYHLGETPHISTHSEYERALRGVQEDNCTGDAGWTVHGKVDDLQAAPHILLCDSDANLETAISADFLNRWARAEAAEAIKPRRYATAR
jgi:DNA-binding Xre family transcriptional regulator